MNIEKMDKLVFRYIATKNSIKWNEIFENEEEMINKLLEFIKFDKEIRTNVWFMMLAKYKKNNLELSEKQISQIKRNCYIIVKRYNLYDDEQKEKLIELLNK